MSGQTRFVYDVVVEFSWLTTVTFGFAENVDSDVTKNTLEKTEGNGRDACGKTVACFGNTNLFEDRDSSSNNRIRFYR